MKILEISFHVRSSSNHLASPDLGTWPNVDPRPVPVGGNRSYLPPPNLGIQFVRLLVTPTP